MRPRPISSLCEQKTKFNGDWALNGAETANSNNFRRFRRAWAAARVGRQPTGGVGGRRGVFEATGGRQGSMEARQVLIESD
jgi:hypothetical protein